MELRGDHDDCVNGIDVGAEDVVDGGEIMGEDLGQGWLIVQSSPACMYTAGSVY